MIYQCSVDCLTSSIVYKRSRTARYSLEKSVVAIWHHCIFRKLSDVETDRVFS